MPIPRDAKVVLVRCPEVVAMVRRHAPIQWEYRRALVRWDEAIRERMELLDWVLATYDQVAWRSLTADQRRMLERTLRPLIAQRRLDPDAVLREVALLRLSASSANAATQLYARLMSMQRPLLLALLWRMTRELRAQAEKDAAAVDPQSARRAYQREWLIRWRRGRRGGDPDLATMVTQARTARKSKWLAEANRLDLEGCDE